MKEGRNESDGRKVEQQLREERPEATQSGVQRRRMRTELADENALAGGERQERYARERVELELQRARRSLPLVLLSGSTRASLLIGLRVVASSSLCCTRTSTYLAACLVLNHEAHSVAIVVVLFGPRPDRRAFGGM